MRTKSEPEKDRLKGTKTVSYLTGTQFDDAKDNDWPSVLKNCEQEEAIAGDGFKLADKNEEFQRKGRDLTDGDDGL